MSINRVNSCVPGLDKIIGGGIPEKDVVLLSGECGTGKTIFGLQFILQSKDSGVYVSFEDEPERIAASALAFGWDARKLEKANKLRILKYDPFKLDDIIEIVESNIKEISAKRVVLDSVSALGMYVKDVAELRRMILQLEQILRKNGCTSVLTSEIVPGTEGISRFGVEEFVADGVIAIRHVISGGEYRRGLTVWKMRGTDHSKKIHPYKITSQGIIVYPEDTLK